jgi:hypothetical protein
VSETPLFDEMLAFFEKDGWNVVQVEGMTRLATRFAGKHGEFHCQATTVEEDHVFVFHIVADVDADKARLIEFLTRANFGLYLGNFEMDLESEQVRFKTSIDVEGDRLSTALVRNAVFAACLTMDRHWPALKALTEGATVDGALATLEQTA